MHLKSVGYTDTVLFQTIGNAVNVQLPDIGKPDIYLLPTYLNFYDDTNSYK
jgi:hypothetical protein